METMQTNQINYIIRMCKYYWSDDALSDIFAKIITPSQLKTLINIAICDNSGVFPNGLHLDLSNIEVVFYFFKEKYKKNRQTY